jgi:hypothetical protein
VGLRDAANSRLAGVSMDGPRPLGLACKSRRLAEENKPPLNAGPVDAEEMSPLALMVRPHGSLPHHSLALVLALTGIRASKPFPLFTSLRRRPRC